MVGGRKPAVKKPNQAHALDGGIPPLLHTGRHWPAASDERRWAESVCV
jgi:hypothetical protein